MAEIRAFRAHRYDLGRVGTLSDVICPPYDVIDDSLQQNLYNRSPFNVVRLEWNQPHANDTDANNRYTRAAGFLREWIAADIIRQDSARGLYVYHQQYEVEGTLHIRKGFFARVRLEPFGQGRIFPHEETMSGPKADRLKLLQATGMNLSPIFGLYPDDRNEIQETLDAEVGRGLPLEATDHLGVISRLWAVTDQQVVSKVIGMMGPKPVYIADGHHRYETGLRYLQEREAAGEVPNAEAPPNFVLMDLVGMSDPGLLILPTHRLVSGIPAVSAEGLRSLLEEHFQFEPTGAGNDGAKEAWERIQMDGSQNLLGFGTVSDGAWQVGRFRNPAAMDALAADHSADWRGLGVSILQVLILHKVFPDAFGGMPTCKYVHLLNEVQKAVSAKTCEVAVLVPPATMGHVERIASHLEKMPPKSTYFYPKLLTGLIFNTVKGN